MTSRRIAETGLLLGTILGGAALAEHPGNPVPPTLQTTEDAEAALARLSEGSDGKTPTVKRFELEWVRALARRGEPTTYTKENSHDFDYIGMPVGGIGAGQLYLGGDGKLWHWDIFNARARAGWMGENGADYQFPPKQGDPKDADQTVLDQGFAIRTRAGDTTTTRSLDRRGFADVRFVGQYPIGRVSYRDPGVPVTVELEAFSPFVPLRVADSSFPATILNLTVKNPGPDRVEAEVGGWLENAVALKSGRSGALVRTNRVRRGEGLTLLECRADPAAPEATGAPREDVPFDDFESPRYDRWTATGTAFGDGPIEASKMPSYQGDVKAHGDRLAASHNARHGETVGQGDAHTGTLTSRPFRVDRDFIAFRIGGGSHPGKTCLDLLVDDAVVLSATGRDSNELATSTFDVRPFLGKTARLRIVDDATGPWGNVSVDHIVLSDRPKAGGADPRKAPDFGTMALAVLGGGDAVRGVAALPGPEVLPGLFADRDGPAEGPSASRPSDSKLVGSLSRKVVVEPGREATVTFVLAWHFPNPIPLGLRTPSGRLYGTRFGSASEVAEAVHRDLERLSKLTRLWRDTWYDSTLPHWFLDRTFLNTSILATSTAYLLQDGRFYGFEGVYSCPGTCTHVWGYSQATGRLFPDLEKSLRERVDYRAGIGFDPGSGLIQHRGEFGNGDAVDGQANIILRTYREHQMSEDDAFLRRAYPGARKAMDYLIHTYDANEDGILEGGQHNTLDAKWYGKITWLSLMYGAALRASAEMEDAMGDTSRAAHLRELADRGRSYIDGPLFNGEYFIQEPDPGHPDSPGSFNGCEYSQLLGQSWAYQVGLGRIADPSKVATALRSLWKYNFTTDVGPYRAAFKSGRWYAMPGEGGLIGCTFPNGGSDVLSHGNAGFAGYMNECQAGYEYGATSLMLWHGLVDRALAHTKVLHERYDGARRNPWNEVECGSHYSRSMASYGLFTAACGYEHHGPKGLLAFAPRISPESFRAAFTAAGGWGTFSQARDDSGQHARVAVKFGQVRLARLVLAQVGPTPPSAVSARLDGRPLDARLAVLDGRCQIDLPDPLDIPEGHSLEVDLTVGTR